MTRKPIRAFVALTLGLVLPASAWAYSFLPGGFAVGEVVTDVSLTPFGADKFSYDSSSPGSLVINASVAQIDTNMGTYAPALGTVVLSVNLGEVADTLFIGSTGGSFPIDSIHAEFDHGVTLYDVTLNDIGAGGAGTLFNADLTGLSNLDAIQSFGLKNGSVTAEFLFDLGTSDAGWVTAFGDAGSFLINLTEFSPPGGSPVGALCDLTTFDTCLLGTEYGNDLESFEAQPNGTLTPLLMPEPSTAILVGAGLFGLAFAGRKGLR